MKLLEKLKNWLKRMLSEPEKPFPCDDPECTGEKLCEDCLAAWSTR